MRVKRNIAKPTEHPPTPKGENITKKRNRTLKQVNTIKIIHERIAYYDILRMNYFSEPTAENKSLYDDYGTHLENVSQLARYIISYIDDNHIENTLLAFSKTRKLIKEELESKALVERDGLIRNPKTSPYEDVPSTGNVTPIILPHDYIDKLKQHLSENLINSPVRILVPCNNMILIVETGVYNKDDNLQLKHDIFQCVMLFASANNLPMPNAFEPEGIVKYILR